MHTVSHYVLDSKTQYVHLTFERMNFNHLVAFHFVTIQSILLDNPSIEPFKKKAYLAIIH